ncbi:dihydropteroate synthase [Terriglobus roseus]|uniref:Dihydropteroate synthase n=2 Tax=Terriglobus roseus TaxID=392734 RepID=A0A1G7QKY3_9BACT|nr:dihydropteroate synthase [Terriglobus roseus]
MASFGVKHACISYNETMQIAPRGQYEWKLRTRTLPLGKRTLVMGILNVTPDSFSDGGEYVSLSSALQHALYMLDHGADIIDVGGESTRPGTAAGTPDAVSASEEQSRILPLIRNLMHARPETIISVDTYRASTARQAIEAGAEIVNDVSGMLWDREMAATCAELRCGVIAMHTRGLPSEWAKQAPLEPREIVPMVLAELRETALRLMLAGCERSSIVLDPGFGFGKVGNENWTLLHEMDRLQELGFPLLAGLSRKGFLGEVLRKIDDEVPAPHLRDKATAAANVIAALAGAHIVRVHDIRRTREAMAVTDAVREAAF